MIVRRVVWDDLAAGTVEWDVGLLGAAGAVVNVQLGRSGEWVLEDAYTSGTWRTVVRVVPRNASGGEAFAFAVPVVRERLRVRVDGSGTVRGGVLFVDQVVWGGRVPTWYGSGSVNVGAEVTPVQNHEAGWGVRRVWALFEASGAASVRLAVFGQSAAVPLHSAWTSVASAGGVVVGPYPGGYRLNVVVRNDGSASVNWWCQVWGEL